MARAGSASPTSAARAAVFRVMGVGARARGVVAAVALCIIWGKAPTVRNHSGRGRAGCIRHRGPNGGHVPRAIVFCLRREIGHYAGNPAPDYERNPESTFYSSFSFELFYVVVWSNLCPGHLICERTHDSLRGNLWIWNWAVTISR